MLLRALLPLLLLSACDGTDVSVTKAPVDADNDGYDEEVDCNDAAQSIHPEAPEVCDGVDQDCDGAVDEDPTDPDTFYADVDADTYGDPGVTGTGCEAPEGFVADATDCDDTDPDDHPGGVEVCNGDDEDCDGVPDDDAVDAPTSYQDADHDGYGNAQVTAVGCQPPDGYVADATDCDDADDDIHPGAAEPDCTDPVDYDCDESVAWADDDADGWAACEDCDDDNAAVNPDATEVCNGIDDECDDLVDEDDPEVTGLSVYYRDADGDGAGSAADTVTACGAPTGYVSTAGDCDDLDAARNPSASEVCDPANLDEDCSGAADDADARTDPATFTTFARDADTDGYGDPARTVTQCDAPSGYGLDATDCDDLDAAVHPGAPEVCDGVDDDCDTLIDDDDPDVGDPADWYADADADGWGGATTVTACDRPAGYVAVDGDCDDGLSTVHPGAAEICNDLDDDCDALVDDADPDVADPTRWYRDADADTWGGTTELVRCDAPSGYVARGGDCDDGLSAVHPGATEVCDAANLDEDCSGASDDADAGTDPAGFITFARDGDADTYGDAATLVDRCDRPSGYVLDRTDCDDTDATVHPGATEIVGNDIDEDCIDGDPYTGWTDPTWPLASSDVVWRGDIAGEEAGYALTVADLDGDGLGDVIAGVRDAPTFGGNDGAAFLFYGAIATGGHLADADLTLGGEAALDSAGAHVYAPGDVDGDGRDDLLVGAHYNDGAGSGAGRVYLVSGATHDTLGDLGDAPVRISGESAGDYFGYYLSGAGDVDGDGLDDVLVGASFRDQAGNNAGKAYVFLGDGLVTGAYSASSADYTVLGAAAGDYLGEDCAPAGDVDGDGLDDFAVGASQVDDSGISTTGAGRVYLFLGGSLGGTSALTTSSAATTFRGAASGDAFGQTIGAGDFDGDHRGDLVVGAYLDDTGGADAGALYVYLAADVGRGTIDTSAASVAVLGDAAGDELGSRRVIGTDVDLDGRDDLFAGAVYSDRSATDGGVALLMYSTTLLGAAAHHVSDADHLFFGEAAADRAGASLAAGDVNGDSVVDLVVGAHRNDGAGSDAGAIHLLYTP